MFERRSGSVWLYVNEVKKVSQPEMIHVFTAVSKSSENLTIGIRRKRNRRVCRARVRGRGARISKQKQVRGWGALISRQKQGGDGIS